MLLKKSLNNELEMPSLALGQRSSMNNPQLLRRKKKSIEMLSCLLGSPSRTSTAEFGGSLLGRKTPEHPKHLCAPGFSAALHSLPA